jgi:FdhE protein
VYSERRQGPVVGRDGTDSEAAGPTAADAPTFPHLRIDACASCERYLLDVDLSRDARAVPEVDELAALPLDLYAAERGLSKITPNLMGF